MRKCSPIFFVFLAVLIFAAQPVLGAVVGKISGRVTDSKTREGIVGANILVEGTTMGAASTTNGDYFIINVPPGTYNLRARIIGYRDVVAENVMVRADFTAVQDFSMEESIAAELPPVIIQAERPIIQLDMTGTTRFMSGQQMAEMPVRGYQEAAYLQTGVVSFALQPDYDITDTESQNQPFLNIRGGRYNEVAYYVDGFSQQDPLSGTSSTAINQSAIQEITVLTGGFNAEYGRVMSGAVNVITEEGGSKYAGSAEAITDNLAGDWISTPKYDYNVYDLAMGGPGLVLPIFTDKVNFYFSGERRWGKDRSPSVIKPFGETLLPGNTLGGWSGQGKLVYSPTADIKLKLGGLYSFDDWREYRNTYFYDIKHAPRYKDLNYSVTGSLTQALSPSAFYTLAGTFFLTDRKRGDGVYFDNLPGYSRPGGNPRYDQFLNLFYNIDDPVTPVELGRQDVVLGGDESHIWDDYLHRNSRYWAAKFDYTNQVNVKHQMKIGAEFQRHTLRYFRHVLPVQVIVVDSTVASNYNDTEFDVHYYNADPTSFIRDADNYGYTWIPVDSVLVDPAGWRIQMVEVEPDSFVPDTLFYHGNYYRYIYKEQDLKSGRDKIKNPITASFYIQDKFEYEGVVINAGVRYDYLNVDTKALKDPLRPLGADNTTLDDSDLENNKVQSVVSPRIGVGFPLSDRTLFHVNYGKFFQQPNLQDLYVSYRYLAYMIRTNPYYAPFGNPNLKPEKTTAYEVGIAHALSDKAKLDVVAYYKDVRDLVEVTSTPSIPTAFATYRNRDYGTIKGIDLGFSLARQKNISANLAYSLSWAMGTGSVSNTQYNIAWTGSEVPKMTAPLAFDQRHKISLDFDLRFAKNEGPTFGKIKPLQNAGINLLFNIGSGQPYTPTFIFNEVTLAAVSVTPSGPINSKYGPWTYRVDLKADKAFDFGPARVDFYVWVLNLFNRENAQFVYQSTGSPFTDAWLQTPEGLKWQSDNGPEGTALYKQAEVNPNNFSIPRMIRFGIKTDF